MGWFSRLVGIFTSSDLALTMNTSTPAVNDSNNTGRHPQPEHHRFSRDEISRAALNIVYPLPSSNLMPSYLGGTVEQCDRAMERLTKRREEYTSFEPPWMRKAIMQWLDYAEREINKIRDDCLTQKSRRDLEAYRKRENEIAKRIQQLRRSIGR